MQIAQRFGRAREPSSSSSGVTCRRVQKSAPRAYPIPAPKAPFYKATTFTPHSSTPKERFSAKRMLQ
ncbi:hypothetical protein JCM17380_20560 [Desulfosporosinus burensis]